jgi:hypothetical protein
MHTIFAIKLAVFLITGLFSNQKRRRLWYSRIFTQIPISPVYVGVVPQAIRTPCLKQGFGVSILHDLCCFNLFRLLETRSKHGQEDQSRSFFCLKLFICHKSTSCYFKFSILLETRSKHEQEDQSRSFFCLKLFICHKSTLCYFNLFRLLETRSKHEQEDQSRSFFCLKLRLHWCFKFSRLLEAWSKHEPADQSRSFLRVKVFSLLICYQNQLASCCFSLFSMTKKISQGRFSV